MKVKVKTTTGACTANARPQPATALIQKTVGVAALFSAIYLTGGSPYFDI